MKPTINEINAMLKLRGLIKAGPAGQAPGGGSYELTEVGRLEAAAALRLQEMYAAELRREEHYANSKRG